MDRTLLRIIKEAIGILKPDGYYFVTSHNLALAHDLYTIYRVIHSVVLDDLTKRHLFQDLELAAWPTSCKYRNEPHHAMLLCKELQDHRKGVKKWPANNERHGNPQEGYLLAPENPRNSPRPLLGDGCLTKAFRGPGSAV